MTVIVSCMQNDFFEGVGKYALQSVFCSLWCMCSHPAAGDQVVWPRQEHHTVAWWPLMIISGCNSGTGIAVVNQTLMLIPLQKRHTFIEGDIEHCMILDTQSLNAYSGEASLFEGFGGDLTKAYMAIQALRDIFQTVATFFSEEKRVGPLVQELDSQTRRAFMRGQLSGLGYGLCQFHVFSAPMNL